MTHAAFQHWTMILSVSALGAMGVALFLFAILPTIKEARDIAKTIGVVGLAIFAPWIIKLAAFATNKEAPSVTFDTYLHNAGTHYVTNGTTKVGVCFKWSKDTVSLPNTQPLYISKRTNSTNTWSNATAEGDWTLIATTTVGAFEYSVTLDSPASYQYYVWHEWVPPTPVHTNGVWLGNVVETAIGETNRAAKMVIIHGQLLKNGKVISK